jgi:hypothetical protein
MRPEFFWVGQTILPDFMALLVYMMWPVRLGLAQHPLHLSPLSTLEREREKMLDVVWTGGLALVMDEPYLSFVSFYCSRSCFFLPRGDQKKRLSIMRTTRQTLGVFFGRVTYVPCHRDFGVSLAPTVYHHQYTDNGRVETKRHCLFVCSRPWWFR